MTNNTEKHDDLLISPISLLNAIKEKRINVKNLTEEQKLTCVELMEQEGISGAEIAEFLKVSTRTIRRYKEKIRRENAVRIDSNFKAEQLGYILQRAQLAVVNLQRITKDNNCPHSVKARAIKDTWTIIKKLTKILQSLGYLSFHSPASNHQVDFPSLDELTDRIGQLDSCMQQSEGCNDQMKQEIAELKNNAAKLDLSNKIDHVESKIIKEKKDDNHE